MNGLQVELLPLGVLARIERGAPLQDLLFGYGVEFPCGGQGRCKGCRIKVLAGSLPITPEDKERLTPGELGAGWRLACRARPQNDIKLDLAQWEAPILTDDSAFQFKPGEGRGIAIDLGTTTIAAQLLDLETGRVLAVRTGLNAQAKHGADIMSRIEFGIGPNGGLTLQKVVRDQLRIMIQELLRAATQPRSTVKPTGPPNDRRSDIPEPLRHVVIVGNTAMHHLFCGLSVEPLSCVPFEPTSPGLQAFSAAELGWELPGHPVVRFLPCLGGFVGSDILAGLLATGLPESNSLNALIDLGTNGEIVVGNSERLLCASTAAGPAFEGARISMGMRAANGAISEVRAEGGKLVCRTLGAGRARGLCGSGLVDAVAAGLDLGLIRPNGRLSQGTTLTLTPFVSLTQADIRELQLAKAAIAAGLRLLLEQWGSTFEQLEQVYLAGAFGNYINHTSAARIGLLNFPLEKVHPAGNTALLGAKIALFSLAENGGAYEPLLKKIHHVSLNEDARFQDAFVQEMGFP